MSPTVATTAAAGTERTATAAAAVLETAAAAVPLVVLLTLGYCRRCGSHSRSAAGGRQGCRTTRERRQRWLAAMESEMIIVLTPTAQCWRRCVGVRWLRSVRACVGAWARVPAHVCEGGRGCWCR